MYVCIWNDRIKIHGICPHQKQTDLKLIAQKWQKCIHGRIYSKLLLLARKMAWVWLFYMHSVCARAPYLLVNNKARNNIPYYIQCGSFFPCSVFSAFQIKRTINICIFLKIEYFLEMGKRNWKKRSKNVAKLYKYRSSVCEITVSTGGLYVNQAPDSSYHSDKQLQSWPSVRAAPDSKWLSYIRFGKLKCSSASIWFDLTK